MAECCPTPVSRSRHWLLRCRWLLPGLLVLGLAGWRYGWPPRPEKNAVYPLEAIDWESAARLAPNLAAFPSPQDGARGVYLMVGSIDETGRGTFDLDDTRYGRMDMLGDQELVRLRRQILSDLVLPRHMSGRTAHAGIFWVDLHVDHDDTPAAPYDPSSAYVVLLVCDASQRHEDAAELIIDLNRNRDLTDDPILTISDRWRHEDRNEHTGHTWSVRVFSPIALARDAATTPSGAVLPTTVEAVPCMTTVYFEEQLKNNGIYLQLIPSVYRKGRIDLDGGAHEGIFTPSGVRFGQFGNPSQRMWTTEGYRFESITGWTYERGTYSGYTMEGDGAALRAGSYEGPTGSLRVETADGQRLRIAKSVFWLRGENPRQVKNLGWTPIPRFGGFRRPYHQQPLPVGDYGIERMSLVGRGGVTVEIENFGPLNPLELPPREFSIEANRSTVFRLPARLELVLAAYTRCPHGMELTWGTSSSYEVDLAETWTSVPQPDSEILFDLDMFDHVLNHRYSIYAAAAPPPSIEIRDESGAIVHSATMEYG